MGRHVDGGGAARGGGACRRRRQRVRARRADDGRAESGHHRGDVVVHARVVGCRRGAGFRGAERCAAVGQVGIGEVRYPRAPGARRGRCAQVVVRHHRAPARHQVDVAVAVRVRVGAGVHVRVVQRAHVVAELVGEAHVAGRAAAVDDGERVRRVRPDPADAAVLPALDPEAHHVGTVGVAQRVHVVHVAFAGAGQAVEIGTEVAAVRIVCRPGVDEPQSRIDAAVRIDRVGRVDRRLDLGADRAACGRGGLVAVDDHHVDGDGAAVLRRVPRRRRVERERRNRRVQVDPGRMVRGIGRLVQFLEHVEPVARGLDLVAALDPVPVVEDDQVAGQDAVDDREGRAAVRQAANAAEPRVALCAANVDAVEVGQQSDAVEEIDRQRELAAADLRLQLPEVDADGALPGDVRLVGRALCGEADVGGGPARRRREQRRGGLCGDLGRGEHEKSGDQQRPEVSRNRLQGGKQGVHGCGSVGLPIGASLCCWHQMRR